LLHQQEQTFIADGNAWAAFFGKKYPDIKITWLKTYTASECGSLIKKYGEDLDKTDTLIIVIAAHTIDKMACTILKMKNNEVDFDNGIITSYTYKYWLSYLNEKGIRILVLLLSCQNDEIIPYEFAGKLSHVTTIYGSNKGYAVFKKDVGSLMVLTMLENKLPDTRSYVDYVTKEWKNKKYYHGNDIYNNWSLLDYYPIQPVMCGPNFYF
jgi:hypothetical protein